MILTSEKEFEIRRLKEFENSQFKIFGSLKLLTFAELEVEEVRERKRECF